MAAEKGEKASQIEFWEAKPGNKDENDDEKPTRLLHRVYSVFNAQQIDAIPPAAVKPREPWEACEAGERILAKSGPDIRYGGDRAYYRRDSDHIQLTPRECFADAPGFYGTATYELVHRTGSEKRLNRETPTKSRGYSPQDEQYAREELIAEIGSMMLAAETGILHDPSQHAAYVQSWLQALKKDKNEIFRAASAASKAADYVLDIGRSNETPQPTEGHHAASVTASRKTVPPRPVTASRLTGRTPRRARLDTGLKRPTFPDERWRWIRSAQWLPPWFPGCFGRAGYIGSGKSHRHSPSGEFLVRRFILKARAFERITADGVEQFAFVSTPCVHTFPAHTALFP